MTETHPGNHCLGYACVSIYVQTIDAQLEQLRGSGSPRPDRVWNRIPDTVRENVIQLALDEPALSPRELAVRFTNTKSYFVSEASVYRLLKARDLIASPAFIVIKAQTSSRTRQPHPTSSGRPISPI